MMSATGKNKDFMGIHGRRNTGRAGLTLIEIMISIAILSLGLISVMQGLAKCVSILRISQDNLASTLLIEDKMAEMEIAVKQDGLKAFLNDTSGQEQLGNAEFNWQIRLSPDQEYEILNKVTATVRWKDGRNSGSSIFSTYLTIMNER